MIWWRTQGSGYGGFKYGIAGGLGDGHGDDAISSADVEVIE